MVYVALLRGINVGGNNKVDMKVLKRAFEQVGMNDVVTYINSGNIIFTSTNPSKAHLSQILEKSILDTFSLQIKVLIRDLTDIERIVSSIPEAWTNDSNMKSDVFFLWDDIDFEEILDKMIIKPDIDTVLYVPGALLWSVGKDNLTKTGMTKIVGTQIYRQMTIRNVNTTRKIYELMQTNDSKERNS